jgi:hypothetical protein
LERASKTAEKSFICYIVLILIGKSSLRIPYAGEISEVDGPRRELGERALMSDLMAPVIYKVSVSVVMSFTCIVRPVVHVWKISMCWCSFQFG